MNNKRFPETERHFKISEGLLLPEGGKGNLELTDILDVESIQALMNDFHALSHIPMSIVDLKGKLLIGVGWQDICTKFHRVHPKSFKNCMESDTQLTKGIPPGEFKLYKCMNNIWQMVTPILVGTQHIGNLLAGQFFFDDERVDYDLFRSQAKRFDFDEEEYIAALERVPRISRNSVDKSLAFFVKLARIISQLSYGNIKLSQVTRALRESEKDLNHAQAVACTGSWRLDVRRNEMLWSDETYRIFGIPEGTPMTYEAFLASVHPDDRDYVEKKRAAAIRGEPYDIEHRIIVGDTVKWVREKAELEFDETGELLGGFGTAQDVTERKQMEEKLLESKALVSQTNQIMAAVLEHTPMLAVLLDRHFNFIWVNRAYAESCKQDPSFFKVKNHFDLYPHEENQAIFQRVVDSGEPFFISAKPFEFPDQPERGVTYWDWSLIPVKNEAGEVTNLVLTLAEVTNRKRAEEALHESENRLRLALEAAEQGTWEIDLSSERVQASPRLAEIFGVDKPEQLTHRADWSRFVFEGDRIRIQQAIESSFQAGGCYRVEYRITRATDGMLRWILTEGRLMRDANGLPMRLIGVARDITESKLAEEALARNNRKITEIVESIQDGFFALNHDWCFTYVNRRAADNIGFTPEDLIGKNIWDSFPEISGTAHELCYRKAMDSRKIQRVEFHSALKNHWYSINAYPSEEGISVYWQDITDRKKAEQALQKAHNKLELRVHERTAELDLSNKALKEYAAKLERLNKELEEFAWISAHDLQEPLRKIQTFGNRLQNLNHSVGEKGREDLQRIIKSAKRMSSLIHSIKSYSDVAQELHSFEPIDLKAVIEEAVSDLEVVIQETGARVEFTKLPLLEADRTGMRQLFQNLIGNAIKYAKADVKPLVRISCDTLQGMCRIHVKDNGIGFEEKYISQLFKPFKRLHGKISRYEGTGMGLAICRKVVEMHRGTITARSEPGEGSTFIITLPLKQSKSS